MSAEVCSVGKNVGSKNLQDLLWPLGGTLFGLIVVPVAIAQYPKFFNENEWVLPASVAVVLICWLVPLLLHSRVRRTYSAILAIGKVGKVLLPAIFLAAVLGLFIGGKTLLKFHRSHLRVINEPSKSSPVMTGEPVKWFSLGDNYGKEKDGAMWTVNAVSPSRRVSTPMILELKFTDRILGEPLIQIIDQSTPKNPLRPVTLSFLHQEGNTFTVTISDPPLTPDNPLFVRTTSRSPVLLVSVTCLECPSK